MPERAYPSTPEELNRELTNHEGNKIDYAVAALVAIVAGTAGMITGVKEGSLELQQTTAWLLITAGLIATIGGHLSLRNAEIGDEIVENARDHGLQVKDGIIRSIVDPNQETA